MAPFFKNEKVMKKPAHSILAKAAVFCLFILPPILSAGILQQTVKDDQGAMFVLGQPPQRIISLAPNITEILFALGLGSKVVAVTRFCDYPPEAAAKEKIGGLLDPNLEKIRALQPDLVIAYRGNPVQLIRKMRDSGLPVFALDAGETLDSLALLIARIGQITDQTKRAASLIRSLSAGRAEARSRLKRAVSKPKVFVLLPGVGLWTCGGQGYLNDLLNQAYASNVAAGIEKPWVDYGLEQLVLDDPDIIVLLALGPEEFEKAKQRVKADSRLSGLRAVRLGRFVFLDENKTSRFGPRLIEAYAELSRALHPECFGKN
jgi:iron complex transport system substrate-binding protein